MIKKKPDYDVGYGKPPTESRFKKGVSGNPRGRPRGSKNLSTIVHQAAYSKVYIVENGRRRAVPKIQAAITQVANKAATGDTKASQYLIQLLTQMREDPTLGASLGLDQDGTLLQDILSRYNDGSNDPESGGEA